MPRMCWEAHRLRLNLDRGAPGAGSLAAASHDTVTPHTRTLLERFLRDAVCNKYTGDLRTKPNQSKVFNVTSRWDSSNHFVPNESFKHFADWHFLHRACLNCIPLNRAIHYGYWDKRYWQCGYKAETLPCLLCTCKPHARAWQLCHNAVQDHLVKAIPDAAGEFSINHIILG